MTTTIIPSVEVPAPTATPYPYGLFSVAPASPPAGGRWTAGTWWRSQACNLVGVTYNPCQVEDPVPEKDVNVTCGIITAPSFTVYARSDESVGGASEADKFAAARAALLAGEQYAVEAALWALMVAATPVAIAAANVAEALAIVEARVAAAYGGTPVIHLGRYTATLLGYDKLVPSANRLVTLLGSPVVAGGGYEPVDPETGEAGIIIGTGALNVMRGEVFDLGTVYDRDVNSICAVVERTYSVGWDCTAVRVAVEPPN